jgi:hypothetical protein
MTCEGCGKETNGKVGDVACCEDCYITGKILEAHPKLASSFSSPNEELESS